MTYAGYFQNIFAQGCSAEKFSINVFGVINACKRFLSLVASRAGRKRVSTTTTAGSTASIMDLTWLYMLRWSFPDHGEMKSWMSLHKWAMPAKPRGCTELEVFFPNVRHASMTDKPSIRWNCISCLFGFWSYEDMRCSLGRSGSKEAKCRCTCGCRSSRPWTVARCTFERP